MIQGNLFSPDESNLQLKIFVSAEYLKIGDKLLQKGNVSISSIEYKCPVCKKEVKRSEYLEEVFGDNPALEFFANLITHWRHGHITSWNKMFNGRGGRYYQQAAKFGDYDEEKAAVNERAKRQLLRKAGDYFKVIGLTPADIEKLQNTTGETLALANKILR